jgi:hypothetical protein
MRSGWNIVSFLYERSKISLKTRDCFVEAIYARPNVRATGTKCTRFLPYKFYGIWLEGCHFFKKLLEDRTTSTILRIALLDIVERTESESKLKNNNKSI